MTQLVQLQKHADRLGSRARPVRLVALVEVDKQGTQGRDVRPTTGFAGTVLLDTDEALRESWDLTYGSVVLIDPRQRVRWRKPGAAFKRPRAELVADAVAAVLARDADPAAVEQALERLADGSPGVRARAARALGELEAAGARAALEARLADPAETAAVRAAACAALARLREAASLECLAAVAGDGQAPREVRVAAAAVLAGFGDDFDPPAGNEFRPPQDSAESRDLQAARAAVLPAAESLLAAETGDLRRLGARILARLRLEETRALQLELAGDSDARVRESALIGLLEWRSDEAVRAAAEARLRDRDTDVKRLARYLLDGPVGKLRQ